MKTDDIIRQAQAKVSRKFIDELAILTGLSRKDLAWLIGLSHRAVYKSSKLDFSILISEHVLLLRSLFQVGLEVFDQDKKALIRWLKTPLSELASPKLDLSPLTPTTLLPAETTGDQPVDQRGKAELAEGQVLASTSATLAYPTPFSLLNTNTGISLVAAALSRRQAVESP